MGLVSTKTNSYDGMNRKLAVATGEQPLLSGLTYAAQGGMQTSTFAKGLKRVMAYNARLQPDEITDTFTGQASCGGKRRSTPANRRGCWSCSCSGLVRFGQTTARQQWQLARGVDKDVQRERLLSGGELSRRNRLRWREPDRGLWGRKQYAVFLL